MVRDERAGACIAERVVMAQRNPEVARHGLQIVSVERRKGTAGHGDGAGEPEGQRGAKRAFNLQPVELRVVGDMERRRVRHHRAIEQPWGEGRFAGFLDEANDRRPGRVEARPSVNHVRSDAVDRDEAWVESRARIDVPVMFARHAARRHDRDPDRADRPVLGTRRLDIDANDRTDMVRCNSGNAGRAGDRLIVAAFVLRSSAATAVPWRAVRDDRPGVSDLERAGAPSAPQEAWSTPRQGGRR